MPRPEPDGGDQGAEVVVDEDHLPRLLRDVAAGAHRDADVGLLERGRVVHGVAGHRDDGAVLLHQPSQPQLVLGGDAAEHVQARKRRLQLVVAHRLDLGAARGSLAESELRADRGGRDRVVAGDHADLDAGLARDPHGLLRGGAQRVDDADQTDEGQIGDGGHRIVRHRRVRRETAEREGEHPQPLLRQRPVGLEDLVAAGRRSAPRRPSWPPSCSDRAPRPDRP